MFFYIFNLIFKGKRDDFNLSFIILSTCLAYMILIHFCHTNLFTLIIPFDLFISNLKFYSCSDLQDKRTNTSQPLNQKRDPIFKNYVQNQISINDTLDYTFKNIGIK